MALTVTHQTTATGVEDPAKQIKKTEWNQPHSVSGTADPAPHAETHQVGSPGGSDPINVEGLSGRLLEGQKAGVLASAQSATDSPSPGTVFDFLGIPSWAKKVTVTFAGISMNGGANIQLRIGSSSGIESSGYLGTAVYMSASPSLATMSNGFALHEGNVAAADVLHGVVTLTLVNPATNTWAAFGVIGLSNAGAMFLMAGSKSLTGVLDRVRLTTLAGTAIYDAGTVNVLYE